MVRKRPLKPRLTWRKPYTQWWEAHYGGRKVGEVFQSLRQWYVFAGGMEEWVAFPDLKHAISVLEQAAFGGKQ